jgi:hypothetical protein
MRAGLRLIKGALGPELLLDNAVLEMLTDEVHCAALRAFRRRVAYCNGTHDWLVNVESAALLGSDELDAVLPLSIAACREPEAGVLWHPTVGAHELPSHLATRQDGAGATALALRPLPSDWDGRETARLHATWDDRSGRRGAMAARLLWRLRSVGEWELHLAHFFGRASFAGGVFAPHIDLVHLPGKVTQPHGAQVVSHLVHNLLRQRPAVATPAAAG